MITMRIHHVIVRSTAYASAMLFPTTIVGSYPQPEWLIDRRKRAGRFPPRVRARELWRLEEPWLAMAQDDHAAEKRAHQDQHRRVIQRP